MSIRVACPGCLAALSYPDGAGGKRRSCPKCEAEFLIPIPSEHPTPLPDPVSDRTPIPSSDPRDPRPTPRPIYKQTKLSEESRSTKHRSGDRHRTRVKVRKKSNTSINPVYLAVAGVAGIVLIGIVVAIGWQMAGDGKPKESNHSPEVKSEQKVVSMPSTFDLSFDVPPGWSINDPKLGYRIAWPIPGDANDRGYSPTSSLTAGYEGAMPNTWSYTKKDEAFVWNVTVIDHVESTSADPEAPLDRYVERLKSGLTPAQRDNVDDVSFTMNGGPTREIKMVANGMRTTTRITVVKSKLWKWWVVCPEKIPVDDKRVTRFLNSFKLP